MAADSSASCWIILVANCYVLVLTRQLNTDKLLTRLFQDGGNITVGLRSAHDRD